MNSVEFIEEFAKYGRALFYIVHRTRNYFHPEYFTYCYLKSPLADARKGEGMNFIQEFSECIKNNQSAITLYHYRNIIYSAHRWATSYFYRFNDKKLYRIADRSLISIDISFLNTFVKFKLDNYKDDIVVIYNFIVYDKEQVAVKTIWRYWKKYRWNYRKNKIDPLKRELVAWVYHPKRLKFFIDSYV